MHAQKKILIISPNVLTCVGLKTILSENFSSVEIEFSGDANGIEHLAGNDLVFMPAETFVQYHEKFRTTGKPRIIVLTEDNRAAPAAILRPSGIASADAHRSSGPDTLCMRRSEREIVEQLQKILSSGIRIGTSPGHTETLTPREIAVLGYVARGYLNKQIADALTISLHTVISHRKNITQKLGIKTVPGLTMYALLHGLISADEA